MLRITACSWLVMRRSSLQARAWKLMEEEASKIQGYSLAEKLQCFSERRIQNALHDVEYTSSLDLSMHVINGKSISCHSNFKSSFRLVPDIRSQSLDLIPRW